MLWVAHEVLFIKVFWAVAIAFIVADTNNYIWNRLWTFKSKGQIKFQYPQFLIVSVIGLALNELLIDLIIYDVYPALDIRTDKASLLLLLAQIICILIISVFNFVVNSLWTFRAETKRKTRAV